MTLRAWAITSGELKPLSRAALLLLGARCAIRVEPWLPPNTNTSWDRGIEYLVASAFLDADPGGAAALRRELSDRGAAASNALVETDEPLGRCMNYATQTLACAIDASRLEPVAEVKRAIIQAAKLSASIAGVLAHAGRVDVPSGANAVEVACVAMWDAIRADIRVLAGTGSALGGADDRVTALRECSALWVGDIPGWVKGQR